MTGNDSPRSERRILDRIRHAFAVDPPGPAEPTADQRRIVGRLCEHVVRRRMTNPALLYLEVSRPLNYIGAQVLHFFQPIVSAIFDVEDYGKFAKFLENRGSVDYLIAQLEHFEEEYETRKKARKDGPRSSRLGEKTGKSAKKTKPEPEA